MKFPIDWHQNCLANRKRFLEEKKYELAALSIEVARLEDHNKKYEAQINLAIQMKRTGFDRELFGKPKEKKNVQH